MKRFRAVLFFNLFLCIALLFATNALAVLVTGVEINNSFDAKSTNALNYAKQVPGRVGQDAPFVLFDSNAVGSVTLKFSNPSVADAYFEYRSDGQSSQYGNIYPHPIVPDDYYYYYIKVSKSLLDVSKTFTASNMVEVRQAFGPEQDWYFDWTAFNAAPAPVPIPAAAWLLGSGLVGLVAVRRRMKK